MNNIVSFLVGLVFGFLITAYFVVKVRFPQIYNEGIKDYKSGRVKPTITPADTTYIFPTHQ